MILVKGVMVKNIKHIKCWFMAHFLKLTDDDGCVSYVNLDLIVDIDVDARTIRLVDDTEYVLDDDLNYREWETLMNFVKLMEVK